MNGRYHYEHYKESGSSDPIGPVCGRNSGGVDQVFAADHTISTNTVQDPFSSSGSNSYIGSGDKAYNLTFQEKDTPSDELSGLITTNKESTVNISNLNELNFINRDSAKTKKGGIQVWGKDSKIDIHEVNTINFGSSKTDLLQVTTAGGFGVAIHGYAGVINIGESDKNTTADVDTLNVYSANVGIMSQQSSDASGFVNVNVNKSIYVYADDASAVQASIFGSNPDGSNETGVSLNSKGTITLESNGYSGVRFNDALTTTGNKNSGKSSISIQATGDIKIISDIREGKDKTYGVQLNRGANSGESNLFIRSIEGDVDISGGKAAVNALTQDDDVNVNGQIIGNNINLSATDKTSSESAIDLNKSALILDGENVKISAANEKAISVSGVNKSDSKGLTIGNGTDATNVIIDGYVDIKNGGKVALSDNTTAYVDSKYLTNQDKSFITVDDKDRADAFTIGKDGKVVIQGIKTGDTIKLTDSENLSNALKDDLYTGNNLQKLVVQHDGSLKADVVSKADAEKLLAGSVLTNVALYATQNNIDSITTLLGDKSVENLNQVANFGELAGLNHGTYTASRLFTDTVGKHLSVLPQDKDLWGYYVHSKESVDGLGLAGVAANYDTTYDGAVVGMDLYQKENTAAGVAVSYINGSLEGAGLKNDADYYGLSFYGRKDLSSFSLVGDVSYLHGSNTITQTVAGKTFTAKPDVDAFTVGVKALKDVALTDSSKLTPYVGARYLRINTEKYSASNGLTYDADSQDLLIVPVGVDYSADFKHGAWTYRPTVGVGYVWNAAGRSVDQTVSLGDAADSFSYNTVDSSSFIAHVGVTAEKESLSFGVGYEYQDGSSTSADKWYVNAAYRF